MRTLLVALAFLAVAVAPAIASGPSTTIAVGGAPTGIAFARGSAWVAAGNALVQLDGASGRVLGRTPLPFGGDYRRLAIAGGRAWVTDGGGRHGSIVAVDLARRRVALVVHVVCCALGITARGLVLDVTLVHDGPGAIVRIDPQSGKIVSRTVFASGAQPRGSRNDRVRGGGALWIAHFLRSTVTRVPLAPGG